MSSKVKKADYRDDFYSQMKKIDKIFSKYTQKDLKITLTYRTKD